MPDQTFTIYLPINKVEENQDGSLTVFGRATQEVPDSANEIMDYESSKPLFQRRSQETLERSDGENLFPLRAMHQNIAAGKVTQFDYKDDERAIDISASVVDANEINKVRAHVYTGFSVGGKYAKRWPDRDGKNMRFTADPREISLVDAPAVPTAKMTLFKIDGDEVPSEEPAWVKEYRESVTEMKKMQQAEQDKINDQVQKLKVIGESAGISKREGSPLTAPKDYPSDASEYGDPANFDYPVTALLKAATIYRFNGNDGIEKYSPRERHALGRRITSLANRFGGRYSYNPVLKKIERKDIPMPELKKIDVGALINQLKAAGATAVDMLAKDPTAAANFLLSHIDDLDVSSVAGADSTAPVTDQSEALKVAATPASTSPSDTETESTPTPTPPAKKPKAEAAKADGPKAKAPPASTSPTDEATETTEEPTTPPAKKASEIDELKADVAKMTETVNTLITALGKKQEQPVNKSDDGPIGALNSLLDKNKVLGGLDETETNIIKALLEGGPYAGIKALKAAGADDNIDGALAQQRVNEAVRKASYLTLEQGNVITKNRYQMKLYDGSPFSS